MQILAETLAASGAAPGPGSLGAVLDAISTDATVGLFARWSRSTVIDEASGEAVLPRDLAELLHAQAGLPMVWPHGNAGLLHVYGYLFSMIATPWGSKHERWTGGGVARALGIDERTLLPWTATQRTPLATLTAQLDAIIAAPGRDPRTRLWLEETDDGVVATSVVLATGTHSALVYAVDGALVTAFPVSGDHSFTEQLIADVPRLRYNAADPAPRHPLESTVVRYRAGRVDDNGAR